MDIENLLVFAAAYFAVVVLPGPGVTALIARVLARGPSGSPAFIAGFVAGALLWFGVAATGLAAIAATFATLFVVIRYAGAAYLLYLAWKFWTAPPRAIETTDVSPDGHGRLFLAGLAINLGNPKAIVFFLALLPTVVNLDTLTPLGFAELAAVLVAIVASVLSAYALAAARARRLFTSARAVRLVNRGSSIAIAGAAAAVATR
ncbi:MAG TPA: LysE family translocator [Vineibacter sp.]|nr:LysE family translocator [Vineibacter sp.]